MFTVTWQVSRSEDVDGSTNLANSKWWSQMQFVWKKVQRRPQVWVRLNIVFPSEHLFPQVNRGEPRCQNNPIPSEGCLLNPTQPKVAAKRCYSRSGFRHIKSGYRTYTGCSLRWELWRKVFRLDQSTFLPSLQLRPSSPGTVCPIWWVSRCFKKVEFLMFTSGISFFIWRFL